MELTPEELERIYSVAYDEADRACKARAVDPDHVAHLAGLVAVANATIERAATIFEEDDSQRWGYTADLAEISRGIRALKR